MYDPITVLREIVEDLDALAEIPVSAASITRARQVIEHHQTPQTQLKAAMKAVHFEVPTGRELQAHEVVGGLVWVLLVATTGGSIPCC